MSVKGTKKKQLTKEKETLLGPANLFACAVPWARAASFQSYLPLSPKQKRPSAVIPNAPGYGEKFQVLHNQP